MKIAIAADGPDLNAEVGHKFGASQYLRLSILTAVILKLCQTLVPQVNVVLACKLLCLPLVEM